MSEENSKATIVIVAEHFEKKIQSVTYELVQFAKNLEQFVAADIKMVLLGDDIHEMAENLAHGTGIDVMEIVLPELVHFNGEVYKSILAEILRDDPPTFICVAQSSQGSEFAPGLACRLNAACLSGVNGVRYTEGRFIFSRDIFGGKISADMHALTETTVLTIQPGSCRIESSQKPSQGSVVSLSLPHPNLFSMTIKVQAAQINDLNLSDARVIVSAGRGIGEEDNLELIQQLVDTIPKAVMCGSRPVIDMGWMPYSRQVGVTGAVVKPDLYIACGISGAAQHVSGMQGSGFIISINSDPKAAIFNVSDICVVEDLKTFIPILLEKITEHRES